MEEELESAACCQKCDPLKLQLACERDKTKQLEEKLESAACCQECGHLRLQLACERDTFVLHLQKCSTSLKELTLNEQCPTADRENDSQTSTGVGYDSTVPSSPRTQYGPLDENSDPGNIGTQGCWQDHIPTAKGVYNSSGCELVNLEQRQANYKQLRFLPQ